MPQYTKSSGEVIDTETMPQPYLERALNKAQEEGNQDNITALQQEMDTRNGIDTTDTSTGDITTDNIDTTDTPEDYN